METVKVKGYTCEGTHGPAFNLTAEMSCGSKWYWYYRHKDGESYHFEGKLAAEPIMTSLRKNREAIEKLLETAQEVEVKLEPGTFDGVEALRVTLVPICPIPADPWPADALEVWRVKRGEEVLHVWKLPQRPSGPWMYWQCEGEDGLWSGPAVALPLEWLTDAPNLVWEQVK